MDKKLFMMIILIKLILSSGFKSNLKFSDFLHVIYKVTKWLKDKII